MICFGVVNAICSVLFGSLMKYIGRFAIMVLGFLTHASLQIALLFWRPNPSSPLLFFIISGLWGVGDAVWQTQVNGKSYKSSPHRLILIIFGSGLYGTLFRRNKEAAFSNYRLWESAGFVIAYAYSTHLCARMKLYVQLAVLCLGFVGYIIVEILQKRKKMRLKKAEKEAAKHPPPVEETDDEKDDIDDEMVITHL